MSAYRWTYGVNPVREVVVARPAEVRAVYIARGATEMQFEKLRALCADKNVSVLDCERAQLEQWVGSEARHQGVAAQTGAFVYADLDDVLDGTQGRALPPLLLVLDSIQDPQNLGSMVRSAHSLGADAVVIPKDRAAEVTPVVAKASAGALEYLPIVRVTNLVRALEQMKQRGIWIVGAISSREAPPPWNLDLKVPLALVIGSEGSGLRSLVEKSCDFHVRIAMTGQVDSLNAGVAAGILLYEAVRQRRGQGLGQSPRL